MVSGIPPPDDPGSFLPSATAQLESYEHHAVEEEDAPAPKREALCALRKAVGMMLMWMWQKATRLKTALTSGS